MSSAPQLLYCCQTKPSPRGQRLLNRLASMGCVVQCALPVGTHRPTALAPAIRLLHWRDTADLLMPAATLLLFEDWTSLSRLPDSPGVAKILDLASCPWLETPPPATWLPAFLDALGRVDLLLCPDQRSKDRYTAWLFLAGIGCKTEPLVIVASGETDLSALQRFCQTPRYSTKRLDFFQALTHHQAHQQQLAAQQAAVHLVEAQLAERRRWTAWQHQQAQAAQHQADCLRLHELEQQQAQTHRQIQAAQAALTQWQEIAEQRRLSTRLRRLLPYLPWHPEHLLYRVLVKRCWQPLRERRGQHNLAIISRQDIFPANHGGAVKIVQTARALSYHYDAVFVITQDREKFYVVRQGEWHEELYPRLLRRLWAKPFEQLRSALMEKGVPSDDAFLYFPLLDNNFRLRVLYVALQKSIEVYQAEFPGYLDAARWAKTLLGGKLSLVEHNVEFERLAHTYQLPAAAKQWLRDYEVALCRRADTVVVVSEADRQRLTTAGVPPARLYLIPHGVDLAAFDQCHIKPSDIRAQYGITADEIVLVFHGIYVYPPNAVAAALIGSTLLPALNAQGYFPKCLAVGRDPPAHSNHPDLIYTGPVDSVAPYIRAADIAVVPLQDGGGTRMKILEYFAASVPVVATAKGAEGIAVQAGRDLLIEDDLTAFTQRIIELINDPAQRQRIGSAGRRAVAAWDWRSIGQHYAELYQDR